MKDTERQMLEALQEYYEFWNGHMVGVVGHNTVKIKHAELIAACDAHTGEHDGRFVISDD